MRKNPLDVANDLITYFSKSYTQKIGNKPILNRGKMKYAMAEILQDWNQTEIKSFIDFYIRTSSDPDLSDFCKRYDEIIHDKEIEENDLKQRKQLMSETQKSVIEFREKYKGAK
jgi:hypothetical protein